MTYTKDALERLKNHREQARANPYSFKFLMNKYCFLVESPTEINKIKIQAFLESLKQAIMDSDPLQLLTTRFPDSLSWGCPRYAKGNFENPRIAVGQLGFNCFHPLLTSHYPLDISPFQRAYFQVRSSSLSL